MTTAFRLLTASLLCAAIMAASYHDDGRDIVSVTDAVRQLIADKTLAIDNRRVHYGSIAVRGRDRPVTYFRVDDEVNVHVQADDRDLHAVDYRFYARLPDFGQVYLVPRRCEAVQQLHEDPPAVKKCVESNSLAGEISEMVTRAAVAAGKSLNDMQIITNQMVACFKQHFEQEDIGVQCMQASLKVNAASFQQQLNDHITQAKAKGHKVAVKNGKMVTVRSGN